jgi:hypothetical protein
MMLPYTRVLARQPIPSLGGARVRYRPVWHIRASGPAGVCIVRAIFDTGSDDAIFEEWVAASIGIDLTNAPTLQHHAAGRTKPFNAATRQPHSTSRTTEGKRMNGLRPSGLLQFDSHIRSSAWLALSSSSTPTSVAGTANSCYTPTRPSRDDASSRPLGGGTPREHRDDVPSVERNMEPCAPRRRAAHRGTEGIASVHDGFDARRVR